jgi:hypothetical protein
VVWVVDGTSPWVGAVVGGELGDVALPEVPEDEVVELDGVSMSLVAGGLVLVMVGGRSQRTIVAPVLVRHGH